METQETQKKQEENFQMFCKLLGVIALGIIEMKELMDQKIAVKSPKRRPIGVYEASKIIKKEIRTIYNLTSAKKIPHYKRGHQLYFFEDELLDYIESGKSI